MNNVKTKDLDKVGIILHNQAYLCFLQCPSSLSFCELLYEKAAT